MGGVSAIYMLYFWWIAGIPSPADGKLPVLGLWSPANDYPSHEALAYAYSTAFNITNETVSNQLTSTPQLHHLPEYHFLLLHPVDALVRRKAIHMLLWGCMQKPGTLRPQLFSSFFNFEQLFFSAAVSLCFANRGA